METQSNRLLVDVLFLFFDSEFNLSNKDRTVRIHTCHERRIKTNGFHTIRCGTNKPDYRRN